MIAGARQLDASGLMPRMLSSPGGVSYEVRRAAYEVTNAGEHVRVDTRPIHDVVDRLRSSGVAKWMQACPVAFSDLGLNERLTVSLVFNSISFCYWPAPWWDNDWYKSNVRRGSWALLAAIRHAVDSGVPILSGGYLQSLSPSDLKWILNGRGRLACLERRAAILREVGSVLCCEFNDSFVALIRAAGGDATALATLIVQTFPSFTDVSEWNGTPVPFQKRAQLLASDCHHILGETTGNGLANFDGLTACADYMLPALLCDNGVLRYSGELHGLVSQRIPLAAGGIHEVEIRAATIVACDLISEAWGVPPMVVNDVLWIMAGEAFASSARHHRTWTEAY